MYIVTTLRQITVWADVRQRSQTAESSGLGSPICGEKDSSLGERAFRHCWERGGSDCWVKGENLWRPAYREGGEIHFPLKTAKEQNKRRKQVYCIRQNGLLLRNLLLEWWHFIGRFSWTSQNETENHTEPQSALNALLKSLPVCHLRSDELYQQNAVNGTRDAIFSCWGDSPHTVPQGQGRQGFQLHPEGCR